MPTGVSVARGVVRGRLSKRGLESRAATTKVLVQISPEFQLWKGAEKPNATGRNWGPNTNGIRMRRCRLNCSLNHWSLQLKKASRRF